MTWLTITEYAKYKGITRQAVWSRIKNGTLKIEEVNVKARRIWVDEPKSRKIKRNNLAEGKD